MTNEYTVDYVARRSRFTDAINAEALIRALLADGYTLGQAAAIIFQAGWEAHTFRSRERYHQSGTEERTNKND